VLLLFLLAAIVVVIIRNIEDGFVQRGQRFLLRGFKFFRFAFAHAAVIFPRIEDHVQPRQHLFDRRQLAGRTGLAARTSFAASAGFAASARLAAFALRPGLARGPRFALWTRLARSPWFALWARFAARTVGAAPSGMALRSRTPGFALTSARALFPLPDG
jgi:hypothetical protein